MVSLLEQFIIGSNRIEGIDRLPTGAEIAAHMAFMGLQRPTVAAMEAFVYAVQPGAVLRDRPGCNVRVGSYFPPAGGPEIPQTLARLLADVGHTEASAHDIHHRYEKLHPFTDGNGRSGRALWLWQMGGPTRVPLGFLHHWYYQTLRYLR